MRDVTTLREVIEAYEEIARAEERYRATVRAAIAEGVKQASIARALNRTRESIRRDAMNEEERDQLRNAEAERHQGRRSMIRRTPID